MMRIVSHSAVSRRNFGKPERSSFRSRRAGVRDRSRCDREHEAPRRPLQRTFLQACSPVLTGGAPPRGRRKCFKDNQLVLDCSPHGEERAFARLLLKMVKLVMSGQKREARLR